MEALPVLSRIGVVGLGCMGQNLALNIAEKGFPVSVYSTSRKIEETVNRSLCDRNLPLLTGQHTLRELVLSVQRPRAVLVLVKPGTYVDQAISSLVTLLEPGDAIIDGSDEWYKNTERRLRTLCVSGVHYLGMGVASNETSGRKCLSLMPGGSVKAYENVENILRKIAALADDGPSVSYIGEGGSGNYVKMVSDGIRYAEMQLLADSYAVLKTIGLCSDLEVSELFAEWNCGELGSFLIEVAAEILRDTSEYEEDELVNKILLEDYLTDDTHTWMWKREEMMRVWGAVPTIMTAMTSRIIGTTAKDDRISLMQLFATRKCKTLVENDELKAVDKNALINDVKQSLHVSKLCLYAQALDLIRAKIDEKYWGLNMAEIARVFKGGCINQGTLLDRIKVCYQQNPSLEELLKHPYFAQDLKQCVQPLRKVLSLSTRARISIPTLCSIGTFLFG